MSGIAGIMSPDKHNEVSHMLEKISHRGVIDEIVETASTTLGVIWSQPQLSNRKARKHPQVTWKDADGKSLLLRRDPLGVRPLYYGKTPDGIVCFASEVKGLLEVTRDVNEIPPGHTYDGKQLKIYFQLDEKPTFDIPPEEIAWGLRERLESVVGKRTQEGEVGSWLSGGLDSSALAALASPNITPFHTFTAGLPDAPDVEFARKVADYIGSKHHELTVQIEDLLAVLPEVIYFLESFDAWLVRSSILNFMVARLAADYVPAVFSGEGGDELFAGYEYLKSINPASLAEELIDITSRLHNTALQRVDRCASAHNTVAHVSFLEPEIVDYALRIPPEYKLYKDMEKWVLRQAVADVLPEAIINRPKAKFWEGAGVADLLAQYAEDKISDSDFARERNLPNGWMLNSKEELLYYRIFCEHFGEISNLSWMGRTKGTPIM